jgi:hypothetical protein
MTVLRAALAGVGGYYFSAALLLVAVTPFRHSLPYFGDIYYDPMVTILAVVTAVGVFVAAVIAYSRGGLGALAIITILAALLAASVLLPFVAAGAAAWTVPSDLQGVTPAGAIALSLAPAVPALLLGVLVAARFVPRRGSPLTAFEAAGAYYLTAVAISLPTPQLDLRMTLPFTAAVLLWPWYAAVIALLAIVAGAVLSTREWPLWRIATLGAVIGLAGAAPVGVVYSPVSLVVVPAVTAAVATIVVLGMRILVARDWQALASRPAAALGGAAAGSFAVGAWIALATMPNPSDRNGPVESYARTGDERKIVACVMTGRGEELLGSSAREAGNTVTVAVRLRQPPSWYFHDLVGITLPVVITLREPLGGRSVIDERTGGMVREVIRSERTGFGSGC